ncbi:hypothetical protein J11TS1_37910 [Oceanobacillus sp. J11TS1]|nr:hypothetical protein J11TS1_37910 [Oceanobacillus sp. J11TS1]
MVDLLENLSQISGALLILCSAFYYFHFKKIKKKRKLTTIELSVYIITQIAILLWAWSNILLFLDRIY